MAIDHGSLEGEAFVKGDAGERQTRMAERHSPFDLQHQDRRQTQIAASTPAPTPSRGRSARPRSQQWGSSTHALDRDLHLTNCGSSGSARGVLCRSAWRFEEASLGCSVLRAEGTVTPLTDRHSTGAEAMWRLAKIPVAVQHSLK